jgi:hypothetical protein
VPRFAAEGGKAIITADANMLKRKHQLLAIHSSNVFGLILPHTWAVAKRHIQASTLMYHWPDIEASFSSAQPGDFWRIPVALHKSPLEKLNINYAQAINVQRPPS